MGAILSAWFRWLAWKAATLAFILALLVGGAWLKGELKRSDELRSEREGLATLGASLARDAAELRRNVAERSRRALSVTRGVESILEQKRAERDALRATHPFARHVPMSEAWQRIRLLESEIGIYEGVAANEARAKDLWSQGVIALVAQRER
jgi:hypothetical protein